MTSIPFPAASGLAQRFTRLTVELGRVIGLQAHTRPDTVPLLTVFCWWLQRLRQRFERLAARAAAGTLPARPAPPRATPRQSPAEPPAKPRQRLPTTRAWLLGQIPPVTAHLAAACAIELRDFLAHPDMLALLDLAPQARRLLRPLCRMLAVDPVPALGIPAHHNRPPARPRAAPAPIASAPAAAPAAGAAPATGAAPAAPPAPPTPYGQGPRDFDPDQYHRHPFLPGHLARRSGY